MALFLVFHSFAHSPFLISLINTGINPGTGAALTPAQAEGLHREQQAQLEQAQLYLQQAMQTAQNSNRGSTQGAPLLPHIPSFFTQTTNCSC
jgi:hypothetical protein